MTNILIFNLILLAVVLETDLGRRKITLFRVARPFVTAAIIVPFFFSAVALSGWGLGLELAGLAAGIGLGLVAAALLPVHWDPQDRRAYSRGGLGYALLWVVIAAGRILFSYGSQHLFSRDLGQFLMTSHISPGALADAFIFLSLAMYLTRSGVLWAKVRTLRRKVAADAPDEPTRPTARQSSGH
ncbi:MAG TPA: hypothetical protein VG268_13625 [Streptosporangiaceae bacterium]|nr:hypothetical protein [Streptosporangiaceae bacterium]